MDVWLLFHGLFLLVCLIDFIIVLLCFYKCSTIKGSGGMRGTFKLILGLFFNGFRYNFFLTFCIVPQHEKTTHGGQADM